MAVIISADDSIVANDITLLGGPALRVTGNRVRFTNTESGRIIAETDQDSAIVITGSGATIVNQAGGVIRSASGSFNDLTAPTILGSSTDDRIENAGTILGFIDMAGGNDIYVDTVIGSNLNLPEVRGGAGDDTYILVPTNTIARLAYFNGGTGTDSLVIEGPDGNVSSFILTSVENVIVRSNSFVESIRGVDLIEFDMRSTGLNRWNGLRFTDSADADIVIRQDDPGRGASLSVYDRTTVRSLAGSVGADYISIGNDTVISGNVDLGGGDDSLTIFRSQFENPQQERVGNALIGGTGADALNINLRGGGSFDAGNVTGFEVLRLSYGDIGDPVTVIRNLSGFSQVQAFQNSNVRLESAALAGVTAEIYGPARLTIDNSSVLGNVRVITLGGGGGAVADDTQSIILGIEGRVLGPVQFSVGDDRLSGDLSQGALVVDGGAGNDTLTGGAFADRLVGGFGADTLVGGGGDDSLDGGSSNDRLDGGTGADLLAGGTGDDSYFVDRPEDLIFENADEGRDSAIATGNFYLYDNIEVLLLDAAAGDAFGVGNALDNAITGNGGANLLIGGAGNDSVAGAGGNDLLFGESADDTLLGGDGIDYLVGGDGADFLYGENQADAIYGGNGDDVLVGGADFATDILVGGDGNDSLGGLSGNGDYDLLYGNAGDDFFAVDTPADLVFEQAGEGIDTVEAWIVGAGYYLYANIENLVLMGITPFGVGNDLDNSLTGNGISNYLLGGAGNDTLDGREGNDVLFGESGADTFVFTRGTGGDVIGDFLPGTDRIDLTGLGFASFAQLQANFVEVAGTTAIDLGQGDLVVLNGIGNSSLSAVDFIVG